MLPNGAFVQGETLEATPDELVLAVSKSSDNQAYPKGRRAISRTSITTLSLVQTKGVLGRVGLTIAGFFAGAALAASGPDNPPPGAARRAAMLGIWVGASVGGYYAGRSMDRKTTLVRLLPD